MQVVPGIKVVRRNGVEFENGKEFQFDAIILATGFKSTINQWLQVKITSYFNFPIILL